MRLMLPQVRTTTTSLWGDEGRESTRQRGGAFFESTKPPISTSGLRPTLHRSRPTVCPLVHPAVRDLHRWVWPLACPHVRAARLSKAGALEHSSSPCPKKRPAIETAAGSFPLLDDETATVVVSYLPSACLGERSELELGLCVLGGINLQVIVRR